MIQTLTPTMEDYLEQIYNLGKSTKAVRVRDIARGMNVKMPSVTSMLNTLGKKDLINHEKYEYVELTEQGVKVASEIARQHEIMFNFLTNVLGIDSKTADEDACKMEHAVSPVTLKRLVQFMEFMESCPRVGPDWLKYFNEYCAVDRPKEECLKRMKEFVEEYTDKIKAMEGNGEGKQGIGRKA